MPTPKRAPDPAVVHLPSAVPGGMDARVNRTQVPGVDDRVALGPLHMSMTDFCRLVDHVLTSAPIKADDPRVPLMERITASAGGMREGAIFVSMPSAEAAQTSVPA